MKSNKLIYIARGDTVTQVKTQDWLMLVGKDLGAKKGDRLDTMLGIAQDFENSELDVSDLEPKEGKRLLVIQKGVTKAWKESQRLECEAKKMQEKQAHEAEQRGMKIIVAAKQGEKIAEALAHDMVSNLSKATKGKFVMDGTSLSLAKGFKPTEADFCMVMGALSNLKGAATEAADQAGFYMVDSITLANEAGFDGNQLLEQVAKEFGVKLFTAQQAQRVGEFFPADKRIMGPDGKLANMSVHQEIMYGASAVKDKSKLDAVIEKVKEGKVIDVTTTKSGEKIPDRKPYSKNEVRKLMDEAAGTMPKKRGAKGGAAGTPSGNILYLTSTEAGDDAFFISDDLSLKACNDPSYAVIDLMTMHLLDNKGNPKSAIERLGAEWFEEPKLEVVKNSRPKKEKIPAATPTPEPEPVLEPVTAGDSGMPDV